MSVKANCRPLKIKKFFFIPYCCCLDVNEFLLNWDGLGWDWKKRHFMVDKGSLTRFAIVYLSGIRVVETVI